jgi:hypothetical protein
MWKVSLMSSTITLHKILLTTSIESVVLVVLDAKAWPQLLLPMLMRAFYLTLRSSCKITIKLFQTSWPTIQPPDSREVSRPLMGQSLRPLQRNPTSLYPQALSNTSFSE